MYRNPAKDSPFRAACLVDRAVFAIGTENTNAINVSVALKDANNDPILERGSVSAYLSDDAFGDTLASAPSGGVAIGTNGLLITQVTNRAFRLVSESDGTLDVTLTEVTAKSFYLILVMPDGHLVASGAITFV